jgi:hypothetical protein
MILTEDLIKIRSGGNMANKTLNEMTTKLDEILDWLTDSPMDNKDYNKLHEIFNKYLEIENKQQKHYYENQ